MCDEICEMKVNYEKQLIYKENSTLLYMEKRFDRVRKQV